MSKWIEFVDAGPSKSGLTREWRVQPCDTTALAVCLGIVKWWPSWRRYTFQPYANTVFEQDCLRSIADFIEIQTRLHKEKKCTVTCAPAKDEN